MSLINTIRKITNFINIDVVKYPNSDLSRRMKLLNHFGINKILDVGANKGQYAKLIRNLGFKGEIISFEPLSKAYAILKEEASKDDRWNTFNFALGNKLETATINVSENLFSSSILDMTLVHEESAPHSIYEGNEKIIIKTLDNLSADLIKERDNLFLKIDVQGFEKNVIDGAQNSLMKIKGIQLEMSLVELYKGEMLFFDMAELLKSKGYKLYSLENGFYNKTTGQLLQVDGIFFKE